MPLWVMADLHLALGVGESKSMEVFGSRWLRHTEKIEKRWRAVVKPADTVVVPGDISWANTLDEAEADFRFLESLPGKKLLGKGNHDYWWTSAAKMKSFFSAHGIASVGFLYNNAHAADGYALAGTRGWFLDEKMQAEQFAGGYDKLVHRECERLSISLSAADTLRASEGIAQPPLVFLHFPPVWGDFRLDPLIDVMEAHGVRRCYFGHIHGRPDWPAEILYRGIRFRNAAADYLDFRPLPIPPADPDPQKTE